MKTKAGVHLPYNHDGDASRVVLEAYPRIAPGNLDRLEGWISDPALAAAAKS